MALRHERAAAQRHFARVDNEVVRYREQAVQEARELQRQRRGPECAQQRALEHAIASFQQRLHVRERKEKALNVRGRRMKGVWLWVLKHFLGGVGVVTLMLDPALLLVSRAAGTGRRMARQCCCRKRDRKPKVAQQ